MEDLFSPALLSHRRELAQSSLLCAVSRTHGLSERTRVETTFGINRSAQPIPIHSRMFCKLIVASFFLQAEAILFGAVQAGPSSRQQILVFQVGWEKSK